MKKMFLAALAVGLLSVSAFGIDGKIGRIKVDGPNNLIIIAILDANGMEVAAKRLVGTPDQIKAGLAIALTAKTTNADVTLVEVANAGGWSNIIIQ